jgi:hypothetical protein
LGSGVDFDFHLYGPVPGGVHRCSADGAPAFAEGTAPDDEPRALPRTIVPVDGRCSGAVAC